ncbi:MAG: hypothetical protein ACI4RG_02405 [Huintestinicola sp.]
MIRIVVKENEVRDFISKDDICRLIGTFGERLEELLKKRIATGEIKNTDYKTTALTIKALLVNYTLIKVLDISSELMDDTEHRKKMINYYVSLWK